MKTSTTLLEARLSPKAVNTTHPEEPVEKLLQISRQPQAEHKDDSIASQQSIAPYDFLQNTFSGNLCPYQTCFLVC
ncbi:hypothetical protein ACOSQ2_005531 [Xanthoceras sorbifolium]